MEIKKRSLGKTQLVIGIIILVLGIAGLIAIKPLIGYSHHELMVNNQEGWFAQINNINNLSYNNETKAILRSNFGDYIQTQAITPLVGAYLGIFILGLFSLLLIILSLFFITQGLINMKKNRK